MSERWRASALLLLVLATPLAGQADGPAQSFQDSLFDRLAGNWTMTGAIGRSVPDTIFLAWAERVGDPDAPEDTDGSLGDVRPVGVAA